MQRVSNYLIIFVNNCTQRLDFSQERRSNESDVVNESNKSK